jgi:hypothetical protein
VVGGPVRCLSSQRPEESAFLPLNQDSTHIIGHRDVWRPHRTGLVWLVAHRTSRTEEDSASWVKIPGRMSDGDGWGGASEK